MSYSNIVISTSTNTKTTKPKKKKVNRTSIYVKLQKMAGGVNKVKKEISFSARITKYGQNVISKMLKKDVRVGPIYIIVRIKNKISVVIDTPDGRLTRFTVGKDTWNKAFSERKKVSECLTADKNLKILRVIECTE